MANFLEQESSMWRIFTGGAFTKEDTVVLRQKGMCPKCQKITRLFRIPGMPARPLRKIIYCLECGTIVYKPDRLGIYGEKYLTGVITLHDGTIETIKSDYCSKEPIKVIHLDCLNEAGTEMVRYYNEKKAPHVMETFWECPVCKREQVLKYLLK